MFKQLASVVNIMAILCMLSTVNKLFPYMYRTWKPDRMLMQLRTHGLSELHAFPPCATTISLVPGRGLGMRPDQHDVGGNKIDGSVSSAEILATIYNSKIQINSIARYLCILRKPYVNHYTLKATWFDSMLWWIYLLVASQLCVQTLIWSYLLGYNNQLPVARVSSSIPC